MIRVNLLRNRVGDQPTAIAAAEEGASNTKENVIKIAFLTIFTVALMFYEGQNQRNLQEEANRLAGRKNELETESAAKAKEAEGVKDVEQQARELEDKLKILKLLSKLRLREVKTLDFMQSSIPEKVWLREVTFETDKDDVEFGRYEFTGNAVATEDLTEFVKRLEDSAYLTEVIVVKNEETAVTGKSATIRRFTFTADVEAKK
ncbi:MAG: PilN domain-containing protein [Bdellovibrionales bacterium]